MPVCQVAQIMPVIDFMYNIVNLETEIKMIWKLKTETKTKQVFKIEIQ